MASSKEEHLESKLLHALSEPNRLRIVEQLREGPLTVGELTDRLQLRQPQVSKHLRILYESGVVEVHAQANRRFYKLRPDPFQDLYAWLERYRSIWEEKFDRLDSYLQKLQNKNSHLEDE
ncbi:ArsR/SmtB family transcription factor [Brevibacillus sp. NRS-1366]|uniref:ArsR/SmtB family transcription factor n=1 Tax=Brevibacillus sp. NRS-1366 TaxID=3233899 RepID=UPI003D22E10E